MAHNEHATPMYVIFYQRKLLLVTRNDLFMQIDLFLLNNILVVSNKILSQELNFDHKKQMPVKKKKNDFFSLNLTQSTHNYNKRADNN